MTSLPAQVRYGECSLAQGYLPVITSLSGANVLAELQFRWWMSPGCNNFNPRSCSISSQRHEHEPVVVMRRLPYSLLASLPLQTRRILFCNSARWSASLDQVSPPSGQGFKPPSTLPTTKASVGKPPFRFETGVALFAKRTPRPFPPPFLSSPSALSSDPLRTHPKASVKGELIKGYTNGDDAVFASEYFIAANDGVGAWSTRPRGHAGYVHSIYHVG